MQLFECPFCGKRNETEFHFAVEAGNPRPEPSEAVSSVEWAGYLHLQNALSETTSEVWVHTTCGEFLVLERNTKSREVIACAPLPGRE